MDYMKKFQFWLDNDYFDEKTKEELLAIRNNASEIEDRFYKDLEFGTADVDPATTHYMANIGEASLIYDEVWTELKLAASSKMD